MGRLLAINALALAFLAACVWFVWVGHEYFAIACLVLSGLTSHTHTINGGDQS